MLSTSIDVNNREFCAVHFGSSFLENSLSIHIHESIHHSDGVFSHQCKCMHEYADEIDVFMDSAANLLVYSDVASCDIWKCVVAFGSENMQIIFMNSVPIYLSILMMFT